MSVEPIGPFIGAIMKTVDVACEPERAFEVFTARMSRWWPLLKYSVGQAQARTCGIEPRVGGSVWEERDDGERSAWGTITVWEPPGRLAFTWHPGRDPETAQEVELRFHPIAGGTRVELEHRGWQKLGAQAARTREGYDTGWDDVLLRHYVPACASA